jgi:long-chain acyl-CoA synthetase
VTPLARSVWEEARKRPDAVAIVDADGDGAVVTAGELVARVNRMSNALVAAGASHGRDIAIVSRNRADVLALTLAAFQIGAVYSMINTHLAVPEVAHIFGDCAPRMIFVDRHTVEVAKAAAEQSGVTQAPILSFDDGLGLPTVDEWLSGHSHLRPEDRRTGGAMLYTSGTSGRTKGVRREPFDPDPDSAAQLQCRASLLRYNVDPDAARGNGVHLVTSPLYHSAPLHNAVAALHLGQRVVIMERFEAEAALRLIEEHHVTWTQVVPTMLRRMLELDTGVRGRYDTSSLTRVIHAGAACPVELKRRAIEWLGPVVWEYYSSTEGGGTVIGPQDWLAHPGSVGKPWLGADIRILDEDGRELPVGEIGDIYFRNAREFHYHNDPEKTAQVTRGSYVTAGDLGWLDDEGYLYIADRRVDLIVSGGVNIYPAEVEAALGTHRRVVDVAAIGKPHPDLGHAVHAVVELRGEIDDATALVAEFTSFLESRLSRQKLPRSYDLRDELPRSETGKLLRRVLRDELDAEH